MGAGGAQCQNCTGLCGSTNDSMGLSGYELCNGPSAGEPVHSLICGDYDPSPQTDPVHYEVLVNHLFDGL